MSQEEIIQLLQTAVALQNQGELDESEKIYREVLAMDENNFYALRFLGCLQSYKGCYRSAILLLRQAVTISSNNSECWFNLGNAYKADFQFQEAIVAYRTAEDCGSTNPQVFNNWGRCLQKLSKQIDSIPVLEKAVKIDDGCFGAWFALGNSWRDMGKASRAEFCYKKSIDALPSFAEAYFNLGIIFKEKGRFDDAVASYRKAIEEKPDFAEAYFSLGIVLREEGEVDDAIASYRKAIEVRPDFAEAYFSLGIVLREEGEVDNAIASYRKAIEVRPDFLEAYFNLGIVLMEEGEVDDAIASYRKAIEEKSDFAEAYLNLGIALKEKGEVDDAVASYRKAIEEKPDFAEAYFSLGIVLMEEGELEDAIASYQKAIEEKPDFADALSGLAKCLMDTGRVQESLVAYEKCSQLNPWDPSNHESPAISCDSFWNSSGDLRLYDLAVDLYVKHFQIRPPVSNFVFGGNASFSKSISVDDISRVVPGNAEFLPSFKFLEGETRLSIFYLHIPKNGGIRFSVPLQECIRLYENSLFDGKFDAWKNAIDLQHSYRRLTALRLNNKSIHDAFLKILSSCEPDHEIDWSLVMSHGSWSSLKLQDCIANVTGQMPFRIGAWRKPKERFVSALNYLYRESGGSLEAVVKGLDDQNPFLHNAIYRYVSDCLEGDLVEPKRKIAADYLLELGDHRLLNQLQSSFLSRNGLPNLIVSRRFNVTKHNYRIPADDEARLLSEFPVDDFVYMDESDVVNSLRFTELPAELSCVPKCDDLHPLTVIVSDCTRQISSVYQSEICLTADLVGERGRRKLQNIFAGKNI